jgi:uncharacterized protein (TIGR00369 family)
VTRHYSMSPVQRETPPTFMSIGPVLRITTRPRRPRPRRYQLDHRRTPPQAHGIVHGGVYCAVVETAGSIGGGLWHGEQGKVVGLANHTDFLRPAARGARLKATALPVHRGRTQQLWEIRIQDESARLIAHGQLRLQNIPHPSE